MPSSLERMMQRGETDIIKAEFSQLLKFIKYNSQTPIEYNSLTRFVEQVRQYILEEVK